MPDSLLDAFDWLTQTPGGLALRIALGGAVLFALAAVELRRKGRHARRWKEYLFLLGSVAAALAYGVVNDQITVRISPEYYLYGKEVAAIVPADAPPEALHREAVKIGLQATWSAGLLAGVIVLLANSLPRRWAPLPMGRLWRLLPLVVAVAAASALVFGLVGRAGWLNGWLADWDFLSDPRAFATVWGIHLGGYVGGGVGALVAAAFLLRQRHRRSAGTGLRPAVPNPARQ